MVLSLYLSKLLVTKRSTMDDFPVPLSPSNTTLTCTADHPANSKMRAVPI